MNDLLRARTFAVAKEGMATGALSDATSAAQCEELQHIRTGDAAEAHRIVSMIALGKANNLFRNGNLAHERVNAIEYLWVMVKSERGRGGTPRWRFNENMARAASAAAIDELWICMCPQCHGAKMVPMATEKVSGRQPMAVCPTCHGGGAREYARDERILALAKNLLRLHGYPGEVSDEDAADSAGMLRTDPKLPQLLEAIDWARWTLIAAEKVAVLETVRMLEGY